MKQLKKVKPDKVQDSAREIYNVYIVPSAMHAVRIDSSVVRRMESYLTDGQEDSAFFEAQIEIYNKMVEKYYRKFVISEEYVQYICQLESALDHFRTQGEKDHMLLNWTDGTEGFDQQVGNVLRNQLRKLCVKQLLEKHNRASTFRANALRRGVLNFPTKSPKFCCIFQVDV